MIYVNLKSSIAIEKSTELCRQSDVLLERLRLPILPGRLSLLDETQTLVPLPKDWTSKSILELLRSDKPATASNSN